MIHSGAEYREAVRRLRDERARLNDQEARLVSMGLGPEGVKRALDPLRSFRAQLAEEVERYEHLERGGSMRRPGRT